MNRRLPFLSNSARRGLLLLEWIIILVLLISFIYSWRDSKNTATHKKELLFPVTQKRAVSPSSLSYAISEEKVETFPFDPNTADSTTLLRLGLTPWQVKAIYKYRAKHGRYHVPEDFKRLPGMTYELWERLGPHVRIAHQFRYIDESEKRSSFSVKMASASHSTEKKLVSQKKDSIVEHPRKFDSVTPVDVNTADTVELMRIPGIGEYRSRKIVEYRRKLGGFVKAEQVMEACRMPDEILLWIYILPETSVRKVNVNKLSLQRLMNHPYISFYQARSIIEYRKAHGDIKGIEELKGLEGFTPLKIEKLQPYLEF